MDEEKIAEIEALKDQGDYEDAIRKIVESIVSASDDVERARYLINQVVCATNIDMKEMAYGAIAALYKLSLPSDWEPVRNYITATSYLDFGRPQDASELFRINLDNPILLANDFVVERYENLAQYGFSLAYLGRYTEALRSLEEAQQLFPNGGFRGNIQMYKASCLGSLGRFEEAFLLAESVLRNETGEIIVDAKLKMAEIRLAQSRFSDALSLYREVEGNLPCPRVSAINVKRGIETAMDGLIKNPGVMQ